MWNAIALVTGGFTLAAFLAATAYWAYRRSLLSKETLVDSVPEAERGRILQDYLEAVHVDTTDLTKQQRFILARELITSRTKTSRERAVILVLFGLITAGVTIFAISKDKTATERHPVAAEKNAPKPPSPTHAGMISPKTSSNTGDTPAMKRSVVLRGVVQDADTATPLPEAEITVRSPTTSQARTDAGGKFAIEFTTSLSEVSVDYSVGAQGYSPTSQAVVIQGSVADVEIALRSTASLRFERLRGRWESVHEDEDMSYVAHLIVRDGNVPTERRGTLEITMTAKESNGFAGGPFAQPTEPSMCRIALPVLLSYTRNALWVQVGDGRVVAQSGQMIGCSAGSSSVGAAKLTWSGDETLIFDDEDPDGLDMTFRRIGT